MFLIILPDAGAISTSAEFLCLPNVPFVLCVFNQYISYFGLRPMSLLIIVLCICQFLVIVYFDMSLNNDVYFLGIP